MRNELCAGRETGEEAGDRGARSLCRGESATVCRAYRDRAREGAHPEHAVHARDAGGVPAGDVRIEVVQVDEEPAHVGHARDAPQPPMGPYFSVAAAAFESYSVTAVLKEALSAKLWPVQGGEV